MNYDSMHHHDDPFSEDIMRSMLFQDEDELYLDDEEYFEDDDYYEDDELYYEEDNLFDDDLYNEGDLDEFGY
jgi:hypothetical protein